ncbi:MAG: glucose-6-phosphate isomerase [Firmicutes bacterium HGW-Firmicutes-20]|nr:MAG: glucose-6-phosphate isomerase [Firmicutes bacterium HGW-Firmicutes-20]
MIDNGMNITFDLESMELIYNQESFGPITEKRRLDDVRTTLRDPQANGPEILYSIAMDVGLKKDQETLVKHNLLYGACLYNKGQVGEEPVRSQGHIHFQSPSCNCSTGELYEIWHGKAIVFMQETASDHPGRIFAIEGKEGDVILVPPGWAHYTVNADIDEPMAFGAWCVRDYGFDYKEVRKHRGLAYYPIVNDSEIDFIPNPHYQQVEVIRKYPRKYTEFNLDYSKSLYEQFQDDPGRFDFISNPNLVKDIWENFTP